MIYHPFVTSQQFTQDKNKINLGWDYEMFCYFFYLTILRPEHVILFD